MTDSVTITCPVCYLDVPPRERCESCGSALPAFVAPVAPHPTIIPTPATGDPHDLAKQIDLSDDRQASTEPEPASSLALDSVFEKVPVVNDVSPLLEPEPTKPELSTSTVPGESAPKTPVSYARAPNVSQPEPLNATPRPPVSSASTESIADAAAIAGARPSPAFTSAPASALPPAQPPSPPGDGALSRAGGQSGPSMPRTGPPQSTSPLAGLGFGDLVKWLLLDLVFDGRMARRDYWTITAIRAGVGIVCTLFVVPGIGDPDMGESAGSLAILGVLVGLAITPSGLAQACRRLHDTGKSGFWNFILLVPYAGVVVLAVLVAMEGKAGPNAYGPAPSTSLPKS